MKHLLILLPLIAILSFTKVPSFSAHITPGEGAKFIVTINNPAKERLHLVVRHTEMGIVADTTIRNPQLRCHFNWEDAYDGEYVLELSSGKEQLTETFTMTTKTERKIAVTKRAF